MINITEDIHSLTEFKKNTGSFIHNLKKTGRPNVLTVNGKAEIVVMDAMAYQKIQEKLELEQTILETNNSLKDFESGKFSSAEKVFGELKNKITKQKKTKKS
jgi:PHD/YefM family antitoxin component YafN of YafNO toxin-antitoxin module